MGWLRLKHPKSDISRRRRCLKRATKLVEVLNFKTDASLKSGKIQKLSDDELIRKQHLTRTSVASSVTGVTGNIVISVACPVAAVGVAISLTQMTIACINRHRVRKQVHQRARSDANFAEMLHEKDRTLKKVGDIAIGVTVRGALTAATMGIVGFDTLAQNFTELGSAAVDSVTNAAADVTSTATAQAGQAASHGAAHVVSHVATHAAGGAIDPSNATNAAANHATIHQQFTNTHPHAAARDEAFHKATQGISDKAAEFMSGKTNLQFNGDSGLHQMQHVWHEFDGDARTKLLFLEQAVADGGLAELAQPLQQVTEGGVEKARIWRWIRKDNKYEKLEDM
ncbi:hypothetical protein F5883DRAFT_612991 [Diaporthe sp. PMI_573]|nr:hypothetical protein F5883DRAFT_612991 [Diaporthaceae sp. PMI_573]